MAPRARKKQKLTILVYCEGLHDMMFMKHLKKLYAKEEQHLHYEIRSGTGGAPVSTVRNAGKVLGDFNSRIAKFDNDKGESALSAAYDIAGSIKIAYCTPAIEATMLEILEPGTSFKTRTTSSCKRRLHQHHMAERDRVNPSKYDEHFPIEKLETARLQNARVNRLIEIFEKGLDWEGFTKEEEI